VSTTLTQNPSCRRDGDEKLYAFYTFERHREKAHGW